jgi:hypothetical protein
MAFALKDTTQVFLPLAGLSSSLPALSPLPVTLATEDHAIKCNRRREDARVQIRIQTQIL